MEEKVLIAGEALKRNKMAVYYAETKDEVLPIVLSLLKKGEVIGMGGCTSAMECGVWAYLKKCGDYNFLDRIPLENEKDKQLLCHYMLLANAFISGANAITENGELYNVDGNSNRVSNIAYGAEQVIVIAGKNKIVKDLDEAIYRVKTVAAPKNALRRKVNTPCAKIGKCISLNLPSPTMTDGCRCEDRMCCNYLVSAQQRYENRIKVILVNEELGF